MRGDDRRGAVPPSLLLLLLLLLPLHLPFLQEEHPARRRRRRRFRETKGFSGCSSRAPTRFPRVSASTEGAVDSSVGGELEVVGGELAVVRGEAANKLKPEQNRRRRYTRKLPRRNRASPPSLSLCLQHESQGGRKTSYENPTTQVNALRMHPRARTSSRPTSSNRHTYPYRVKRPSVTATSQNAKRHHIAENDPKGDPDSDAIEYVAESEEKNEVGNVGNQDQADDSGDPMLDQVMYEREEDGEDPTPRRQEERGEENDMLALGGLDGKGMDKLSHLSTTQLNLRPPTEINKQSSQIVCSDWLNGNCPLAARCSYVHQFDLDKMPMCKFERRDRGCWRELCPFTHRFQKNVTEGDPECDENELAESGPTNKKEPTNMTKDSNTPCLFYLDGFCPLDEICPYRHIRLNCPPIPLKQWAKWCKTKFPKRMEKYVDSWLQMKDPFSILSETIFKEYNQTKGIDPEGKLFSNLAINPGFLNRPELLHQSIKGNFTLENDHLF